MTAPFGHPESPSRHPLGRTAWSAERVRRVRLAAAAILVALVQVAVLCGGAVGGAAASVRATARTITVADQGTVADQVTLADQGPNAGGSVVAAGQSGCQVVHIGPFVTPGSPASSYFDLRLRRSSVTTEALVVANPQPYPCRVTLVPAYGATAVNGGDSYVPVQHAACRGASCWLGGLPETLILPPRGRENVAFPISVPRNAASGQYLAGVIAEPASPPPPAKLRSAGNQQGVVSAAVVARVAIGVAITIPGSLVPRLSVPQVLLSTATVPPSLQVVVANTGNTWIHPRGHLRLTLHSGTTTVALRAATVLPGSNASIDVPVGQLPPGPHQVSVDLPYGPGRAANWQGTINFPSSSDTPPPWPGTATTIITEPTVPRWIVVLLVALAAALLLLGATVAFILLRRRRHGEHEDADSVVLSGGRLGRGGPWRGGPRPGGPGHGGPGRGGPDDGHHGTSGNGNENGNGSANGNGNGALDAAQPIPALLGHWLEQGSEKATTTES